MVSSIVATRKQGPKQQAKLAALQAAIDDENACDVADDIDGETAHSLRRKLEGFRCMTAIKSATKLHVALDLRVTYW